MWHKRHFYRLKCFAHDKRFHLYVVGNDTVSDFLVPVYLFVLIDCLVVVPHYLVLLSCHQIYLRIVSFVSRTGCSCFSFQNSIIACSRFVTAVGKRCLRS